MEPPDDADLPRVEDLPPVEDVRGVELEDVPGEIELTDELPQVVVSERPKYRIPHDFTRHYLTLSLVALIAFIVTGTWVLVGLDRIKPADAGDLLVIVLPSLFTLLGTSFAFYFPGSKEKE